jgi:uncharacterized membrane protein (DUF4010 family)
MSRLASEAEMLTLAALAVSVGVLSNTLMKLAVVLVVGRGEFRRRTGTALLALAAACAGGLWLGAR